MLALSHWEYPKNIYEFLAEEEGLRKFNNSYKLLYLPPYHPECNAIEVGWEHIKNYLEKNPSYDIERLQQDKLPEAFLQFTAVKAKNIVDSKKKALSRW